LFLDEPTTGLDPRSRIELWGVIRELVSRGATLLLTTQYLEEADQLADDIVVIDHGRAIASGTADQLKAQVGGERIELVVADAARLDEAHQVVAAHAAGDIEVQVPARSLQAPIDGGVDVLTDVLQELRHRQIEISDVGIRRPTLDDVFLTLTGHVAEEPDDDAHHTDRAEVTA
ncbi:MAG TPA: daunorubicin/doxorubicin resistance ABC transporter ATP-binding protein DrrA, partial [Acidimicrobiaceae bacterium]|nr:daunorubicin/doxorubicin resistance ABC transporter ATP-binding protein DrrA [Acidimicrobiaceae bacterium]